MTIKRLINQSMTAATNFVKDNFVVCQQNQSITREAT